MMYVRSLSQRTKFIRLWSGWIKGKRMASTFSISISGQVLSSCADHLTGLFSSIYNETLAKSVVPSYFEKCIVIPVLKNNTPTCLNDYCPVALTSAPPSLTQSIHSSLPTEPIDLQWMPSLTSFILPSPIPTAKSGTMWVLLFIDYNSHWAPQGCVLCHLIYTLYTLDCVPPQLLLNQACSHSDYRSHLQQLVTYMDELDARPTVSPLMSLKLRNCLWILWRDSSRSTLHSWLAAALRREWANLVLRWRNPVSNCTSWDCWGNSGYPCTPENVLYWNYRMSSDSRRAANLQWVVQLAECISRSVLPTLHDIYTRWCTTRAAKIIKYSTHPGVYMFSLLESDKHFHWLMAKTKCLWRNFFSQAILNISGNVHLTDPLVFHKDSFTTLSFWTMHMQLLHVTHMHI